MAAFGFDDPNPYQGPGVVDVEEFELVVEGYHLVVRVVEEAHVEKPPGHRKTRILEEVVDELGVEKRCVHAGLPLVAFPAPAPSLVVVIGDPQYGGAFLKEAVLFFEDQVLP